MIPYDLLARQALDAGFGRLAAGVVVFDVSGRVLMLRRKPDDVLPGLWDYPAGGLEDGERPDAGAARELFEECGIRCTDLEYVRALDFTDSRGRRTRQFVFTATVPDGTAVTPTEHDAYTWADLDDLPPTSDGHREVLGWLKRLRVRPGWRPVGRYIQDIATVNLYGSFYVTDPAGNPLCLQSAPNPDIWQFPGGDTDPGESPFGTALREFREETGLDLAVENPEIVARRQLLAVIYFEPTAEWPLGKVGHVFWGGVLSDEQLSRIRLSAEHLTWSARGLHDWFAEMRPQDHRRLLLVDRARRAGITVFEEQSSASPLDRHGVRLDFEGILAFVTTPDRSRLLMNLRDEKPGIAWPAHWTPIGGRREGVETAFESATREVREEAGILVKGLRELTGPHHPHVHGSTVVLAGVFDGAESDLVLGEGQAVRLVPLAEVLSLKVPPYMAHYLPRIGG
ncbi:NUDIX domain-containing protein [Kitasatospora sp. NPDC056181]|uniref:NUDIX hydrolase n=1 Tax=Kitasatospora sp. NPDC056181 TaxID=3345737 RepID=UPI0035DBA6C8